MTRTLPQRLTLSMATMLAVGVAGEGFAQDKELIEATEFTGTLMFLSAKVPGLIFGAVRAGETAFAGFGEIADGTGKEPDENSIFRIGWISKVFCGTALGALVVDGKVELTDRLQDHIDAGVTVPEKDGRSGSSIWSPRPRACPANRRAPMRLPTILSRRTPRKPRSPRLRGTRTCSRLEPRRSIPTSATTSSASRSRTHRASLTPTCSRSACSIRSA